MPNRTKGTQQVKVNRAPVLTLWAAVVAERLGFDRGEALTMGRAVAGLNAYAKGLALGIYKPSPKTVAGERKRMPVGEVLRIDLLRRAVEVERTPEGLRALTKGQPISPDSVERYLEGKFGEALKPVESAMTALAKAFPPEELATHAYELYEEFRPAVPAGVRGWGATGILDLDKIRSLARRAAAG